MDRGEDEFDKMLKCVTVKIVYPLVPRLVFALYAPSHPLGVHIQCATMGYVTVDVMKV